MSPDAARPRWRSRGWIMLGVVMALVMLAAIFVFPVRYIRDLRVEGATQAAPARVAVTFSTGRDLAELSASNDYAILWAVLSACDDAALRTEEVVTQRIAYVPDHGRVRALGALRDGDRRRFRYRATFDAQLTASEGLATRRVAIDRAPGGLCLSIHGGGMWPGVVWSRRVPVVAR